MSNHYCIALEPDNEQWWPARCNCGWDGGMFPSAEEACDSLMEHAYTEATREAALRAGDATA